MELVMDRDPLGTAKGIALGVVIGIACWSAIFFLLWP
jgi:hypothetical protein